MPVTASRSLKALATLTASWPVIASATSSVSFGWARSEICLTSVISSSSIERRPAVSRIRTSKPSRRAVSIARRVMASGISSGTIGRVATPVCSPRILSCCWAAGRRVSSEAIMTLRRVEKVPLVPNTSAAMPCGPWVRR